MKTPGLTAADVTTVADRLYDGTNPFRSATYAVTLSWGEVFTVFWGQIAWAVVSQREADDLLTQHLRRLLGPRS